MIDDWKKRPTKSFDSQSKFIKSLRKKRGNDLDHIAEKIHHKVFQKINCLDCANCCKTIPPIVGRIDKNRIAKYLNLSVKDFESKYLLTDEDGDVVINSSPCPFLGEDNYCSIYEVRPKACRSYPHTDHLEFSKNLHLHTLNNKTCPAVFHIIERLRAIV